MSEPCGAVWQSAISALLGCDSQMSIVGYDNVRQRLTEKKSIIESVLADDTRSAVGIIVGDFMHVPFLSAAHVSTYPIHFLLV